MDGEEEVDAAAWAEEAESPPEPDFGPSPSRRNTERALFWRGGTDVEDVRCEEGRCEEQGANVD